MNASGTVIATHPLRPEITGLDWSGRTYFRQMLSSPAPVFSDVIFDDAEDANFIEIAVPVIGGRGEFSGAIIGKIRLRATGINEFYGGILRLRIGNGGSYIVDGNGTVLYHDNPNQVGLNFSVLEPVEQVLRGQVGAIRNTSQAGTDQVSGYSPIPGTPWGLVTEESWSSLTSSSRNTQRYLILLLSLGVAVPAIVVAIGVKRVMQPVEELRVAAKEVAGGNFSQTIAVHSGDEIEELANEFNQMAEHLEESYEQLEQRVVERTGELTASELRYRNLFEESRDAIFVTSLEGLFIDVNLAATELFGSTREEIINSNAGAKWVDPQARVSYLKELNEKGSVNNFEMQVLRNNGTVIDCEVSAILRQDEGDSEATIQGIVRDVTQRKLAEKELQDIQKAERETAVVTSRLAETGRIVTANLDVTEVYGRFAEEVKKLVEFDRISVNVIDDTAGTFVFRYVSGVSQSTRKAGDVLPLEGNQTGEVFKTGRTLVRQDVSVDRRFLGDRTLLETGFKSSIVLPLKYQGRIIGVLSLRGRKEGMYGPRNQAILEQLADQIAPAVENARLYAESQKAQEELRQAEQKYRRVFDDSKDPIFLTTGEGNIIDSNEAASDLFRYSTEELSGLKFSELCEDHEVLNEFVALANDKGFVRDFEIRMLKKNGSPADCVASFTVQRNAQGSIVAYHGMVRDITDSKQAELDALQQTREVAILEERNRMAREIHDTMAQGFTGIVLQMEAAEQSLDSSPEALPAHLDQARALARQGLQEARRSVWGLVPQALEQSTLDTALKDEVQRFDAEGRAKIIFTQSGTLRDLSPDVQTVVLRICQESLTNIRRHAGAGQVDINLDYHEQDVVLSIKDDGAGFEPEIVADEKKGVSFGLTGMRQRAEQINGQLIIDSEKGQGTLVRLTIPTS
ncbi:MAG: PAS domain S-box protein [Chloroflexi bacterium]|nr:PAS domain S-box protein [Chloroflexota bacterium]